MIGTNYQKVALQKLCEITSSKRIFAGDYKSEGIPFYRGKEITEKYKGNLGVSTELFISRRKFEEIKSKFGAPKSGDLLLTSVGTLGSPHVVKPGEEFYFKDGNITWFRNFKNLDSYFLYYWLVSPQGKAELKKCTIGSSQSAFTIVLLKCAEIELPPLHIQQGIASILSAYDDLIENNTRRIAILEEMARRIYEEWFVNFHFSRHDKTCKEPLKLGAIPKGWKYAKLGNLASETRRSVEPSVIDPDTPYVGLEHIPRRTIALSDWGKASDVQSMKLRFDKGDILFGKIRPYFHKVSVAPLSGVASSDAIIIKAKEPKYFPLVLATVSSDIFIQHATQTSNGTKMPRANWNVLVEYPIPIPNEDVLNQFNSLYENIVATIMNLVLKNRNLRATRDLLLPKLISGEIDLSQIVEVAEKAAAL